MREFSGANFKTARRELGISQTQLAHELGVEAGTINSWEAGARTPKIERLPQIATALRVKIEDLFEEAPDEIQD